MDLAAGVHGHLTSAEASSGKTQRRKLNRGVDRRANSALRTIVRCPGYAGIRIAAVSEWLR
jgi:hypothetical protein